MGLNQITGQLFAVKKIDLARECGPVNLDDLTDDDATDDGTGGTGGGGGGGGGARPWDHNAKQVQKLEREIELMKQLEHKHIVRYLGTSRAYRDDEPAGAGAGAGAGDGGLGLGGIGGGLVRRPRLCEHLFIFLEYVPGGSVASMLSQFGVFNEDLIRHYMRQILSGVHYLHSMHIIHRDIKGANVLVNEQGVAKLADFGCSKQLQGVRTNSLEESLKAIRGSVPWMAPEVIKQTGHGRRADIWSVGATMLEMATATHPWPAFSNNLAALFHIATTHEPPPVPDTLSAEARTFLDRCFVLDPQARATAAELLASPFIHEPTQHPQQQQQQQQQPARAKKGKAKGKKGKRKSGKSKNKNTAALKAAAGRGGAALLSRAIRK